MNKWEYYGKLVGQLFDGRYRIEKLVGVGGMSVVYKATDEKTGNTVAIKKLKDDISSDEEAQKRFFNEAQAISLLRHPNIVGIYEACTDRPEKYLAMEYVEGITLRAYMDRRKVLTKDEVICYSEQILAALDCAHKAGIVHRDIKPQNIMLLKHGRVKITDFGIAKTPGAETAVLNENAIGTVYYISPEQAEGGAGDNRSDIYSLGAMMYEMATGKLPFYDERAASVLLMQMQKDPEPPRLYNKKIPRSLETLILCAMEKNPDKRYQSALDMFRELRKIKQSRFATVLTPAQIKAQKRSERNRDKNRPSRSFTPVLLGISFALLAVAIVAGFTVLDRLNIGNIASVSITVPDVTGKSFYTETALGSAEAYEKQLEELGLSDVYNISVDYVYSTYDAEDVIIKQSPAAGSSRRTPCDITLTVSLGPEKQVLSDYARMEYRNAETELKRLGYIVVEQFVDNPVITEGTVISTEPVAGSVVTKGSTVTLLISKVQGAGSIEMPDLRKMTEAGALSVLNSEDVNLCLGEVIYTRSTYAAGTVICHTPAQGERVNMGSTVDFVVSGGPDFDFNYYPSFSGMSLSEVTELLKAMGCTVSTTVVDSYLEKDTVVSQMPLPGTQDNSTKTVTLEISGGSGYSYSGTMFDVTTGMTLAQAKILLEKAYGSQVLLNYNIIYKRSELSEGRMLGQSPAAGEEFVASGGILDVTLTVSGGPDYPEPVDSSATDSSAIDSSGVDSSSINSSSVNSSSVDSSAVNSSAVDSSATDSSSIVSSSAVHKQQALAPDAPKPECDTVCTVRRKDGEDS